MNTVKKDPDVAGVRENAIVVLAMLMFCLMVLAGLFYSGYLVGKKQAINQIENSDEYIRID